MPAERRLIVTLFAIALGVRVLYGIVANSYLGIGPTAPTGEMVYAQKIASGFDWIATPYSPLSPGYPALLALVYLIAFKQVWIAFFLQAAISALAVIVLYWTAVPVLGRRLSVLAALWYSFYVLHLHYTSIFVRDSLVVLLVLLLVSILARPLQRMRLGTLAGICYAALVHVDPQFILMAPVLGLLVFFKTRHTILNLQYLFLFVGAALLLTVPWTIRNQIVYRQPLPVGLEAVPYLKPLRIFTYTTETMTSVQQKVSSASETRRIENNSIEFWRITRFRDTVPLGEANADKHTPAWSLRHNLVNIACFGVLIPFFLVGVVAALRRRERTMWMAALIIAVYFLMRAWMGGNERTRLVVDPFIILVAFYGVKVILETIASRRAPADPAAVP